MGSVVGEKITRAIERGTKEKAPVIVFSAAGGARMHEGLFALMQMAKTSGALALHAQARLPFISVLTNPTTGGVTASFATLGDLIVAEPKSIVGFAGPRVIRETTHQNLPPDFQTAEFLHEHGLIHSIIHRKKMRPTLAAILGYPPIISELFAGDCLLYETQYRGIKLGLEQIHRLLDELGFMAAASVSFTLPDQLQGFGLRDARLGVPRTRHPHRPLHLPPPRQLLRAHQADRAMISEQEVADGLARIREIITLWGTHPTFFEIATALALDWFQRECGCGGWRLVSAEDSTPPTS